MLHHHPSSPPPPPTSDQTPPPPAVEYIYCDTVQSLEETISWLDKSGVHITLDCEATGLDPVEATPLLLQLGNWAGEVRVIPLAHFQGVHLTPLLTELSQHIVIGHNLNYDYRLLKSHYPATRFPRVYDTQLAEQVLTCGHYDKKGSWLSQLSLAALAQKYLGVTLDKSVRLTFTTNPPGSAFNPKPTSDFTESVKTEEWSPSPEQLAYAARDVAILPHIVDKQLEKLSSERLLDAVRLRFSALVPLAEVEMRGMLIDQKSWRQFLEDIAQQRQAVETELRVLLQPAETEHRLAKYEREKLDREAWEMQRASFMEMMRAQWEEMPAPKEMWGRFKMRVHREWVAEHPAPDKPHLDTDPINLGSPAQMLRAYHFLGLSVSKTDKKTREGLLFKALTPDQLRLVELHQQHSQLLRMETGFGENILARIVPTTGRLHTHLNIGLTSTGRMSSESPNFQNMPNSAELRHSFVADPGMYVVTADFSGQELAIGAALSQCRQMKDDLAAGRDLYKELAVMVWGGTVETITKDQRRKAKSGLLGISYGMGVPGMVNNYHMAEDEAKAILTAIRTRYHEYVSWGDQQAFLAKRNGYVETASGARRYFPDAAAMGWKLSTEARNAPVQGTAAEVIYRCAVRNEKHLVPQGILPVNYVHDEVVSLAPNHIPQEVAMAMVEREMIAAFYDILPYGRYGVRVRVEMHAAPYWSKD